VAPHQRRRERKKVAVAPRGRRAVWLYSDRRAIDLLATPVVLMRSKVPLRAGLSNGLPPVNQGGSTLLKPKLVAVRAYVRLRFGRLENVCAHMRSWPGQMSFNF
jgi:hypothetical protein